MFFRFKCPDCGDIGCRFTPELRAAMDLAWKYRRYIPEGVRFHWNPDASAK